MALPDTGSTKRLPVIASSQGGGSASAAKPGTGPNNGPQTAEKEPVLNEQQAGKNPKNVGGEAAVNVAGPASAKKP